MRFDPTQPFTLAMALEHGMTRGQVRGPGFTSLLRNVHIASSVEVDHLVRVRAALLLHPGGAVITHHTAAELQRLPVPRVDCIHLSVRKASDRRPQRGLRPHVGRPAHTTVVDDVRVSTGSSLFWELSHSLGLVDLVVLGDALVRRGLATLAQLLEHTSPGSRAHDAARLVRERVDSPMETRVRVLLVLAGFPEPEVNWVVEAGGTHYRLDLCWPDLRLVVEYDGQHHRGDLDQWQHDLTRREWLEGNDWSMLVFVSRDIFRTPQQTLARTYAAWVRSGGAPFAMRNAWVPHFPETRRAA